MLQHAERTWRICLLFNLAFLILAIGSSQVGAQSTSPPQLVLKKGDRIAIIGNTLADRMQHDAWLDTYLYALHPELELVVRNLGFPGDELKTRSREENFGSPDQWLTKTEADVVFCFFGYNESLRGEAGLDGFRKDLAELIDSMKGQ
jgi:hypothetical protein